jgi:hypothetical protein
MRRHAAESLESTILEKLFPKLARNFPSLLHSKCFMCSPVLLKVSRNAQSGGATRTHAGPRRPECLCAASHTTRASSL